MKFLRLHYFKVVVFLLLLVVLVIVLAPVLPRLLFSTRIERSTLEVLKQEQLAFLVTDRITSQIVVEVRESNVLLGKKEGYLIAKAKLYYGIDLNKLQKENLVWEEETLVVRLPEPEELDFAVDLESMRYISKRSALMVLADLVKNEDHKEQLRKQFKETALEYMRQEQLIPDKQDIIRRLSSLEVLFSRYPGMRVEFR